MLVADFKALKNVLGGTLNDVVLATVSGAVRRFFLQRGSNPDDLDIRALVPVSVRTADQHGQLNNRATEMVAPLPVDVDDAVARLDAVRSTMSGLKESKQALGGEVLTAIAEWTVPNLLVQAVRLATRTRPYNLIVTNVPGPQIPLYLLGCEMRTAYPVVPLFNNMALAIGLFSYNGGLFWGSERGLGTATGLTRLHHCARELVPRTARASCPDPSKDRESCCAPATAAKNSASRPISKGLARIVSARRLLKELPPHD